MSRPDTIDTILNPGYSAELAQLDAQIAFLNSMLAATKAVGFAEDAHCDARDDYRAGQISVREYSEVEQALWTVRSIAAAGTRSVESP